MPVCRPLRREEIESVWRIDRREIVHEMYHLAPDGTLRLEPSYHDVDGWPPEEIAQAMPLLQACFDRGGWFLGAFDAARDSARAAARGAAPAVDAARAAFTGATARAADREHGEDGAQSTEGAIVGAAALDSVFIGERHDALQLVFLHVSHAARGAGLGARLFDLACHEARRRGAARLYVSATPSEATIRFYLRRGCTLARRPDPILLAREPDDIHLECRL